MSLGHRCHIDTTRSGFAAIKWQSRRAKELARSSDEAVADDRAKDVAGHTSRVDLVTSAAAAGVGERVIMSQTMLKRAEMMRKYVRLESLLEQNAAARVGL